MKLWLVTQDERTGYDTFDMMVVAARDEEGARRIYPQWSQSDNPMAWPEKPNTWDVWASSPENVKVKLIGTAAKGIQPGVICSSFNAG